MKRVSLIEAPELAPLVERMRESMVLTTDEGPVAVVLTVDDYRDLRAMADLAEDPARVAEVFRTHKRFQAGEPHEAEEWRAVLE